MLYAIAVGALLAVAAWVADAACRLLHRPRRGVWATALTGAMGHRPFVWLVLDTAGRVVQSATGADHMMLRVDSEPASYRDRPDTSRVLDAYGVFRTFPSLHEQQLHSFGWRMLTAGADTVNVIWVRPTSLGWTVTDQGTALRDAAGASRRPSRQAR